MKLKNFNDYEIDVENGTVWSYKSNRFIGAKHPKGYWYVGLMDNDGKQHNFILQRLIWIAVNGNIPEGLQVNHIDENKSNNSITNLNLMTCKENCNFGTRNTRRAKKQSKQVAVYKDGVLVMTFASTAEAGRKGFDQSGVAACCRGKLKSYKGYQWKYIN